jgi:hypothetical protein
MNTDTQKTWTLHLTPEDAPAATVKDIPQDEMISILWQAMHGFGSLEQLAIEAVADRADDREHLVAA